ncbi:hypothetical protein CR492_19405 [Methylocella silvestris]|uniref:Uncharacterized protein n=2 Tax=Methylocella silvestris TaxID=199596 RepID=A0A2J7TBZ3_METSI|nr:hypothetical protein CR492_19405 [Methylocella silvestris]
MLFLTGVLALAGTSAAGPARCSGSGNPMLEGFPWPPFKPALRQEKTVKVGEPGAARFQDRSRMNCVSIACPGVIILGVGF